MSIEFNADHKDALQEFMNISMGRAANKLATLLDLHVTISVPNVQLASDGDMAGIQSDESKNYFTRQSFYGDMDGELITVMSKKGCQKIVDDLNDQQPTQVKIEESILDISNILSGASLKGLCQQIDVKTKIQPPVLFEPSVEPLPVNEWKLSLILEITFLVETAEFTARTIICFANKDFNTVLAKLDELM